MENSFEYDEKIIEYTKRLFRITEVIDGIYERLYNLEISGNKNSDKYNKAIRDLNIALEVESSIYSEITYDSNIINSIINYILATEVLDKYESASISLLSQKNFYKIPRRIINNLFERVHNNKNFLPNEPENKIVGVKQSGSIYYCLNNIDLSFEINNAFINEIFILFLNILEEYIENEKVSHLSVDLMKIKYDLSFVIKRIETKLISENFDVKNSSLFLSDYMKNYLDLIEDEFELLKQQFLEIEIYEQIPNLLNIHDYEYNKAKKMIASLLRCAYLRAGLLLLNEEEHAEVKDYIPEYMLEEEYKPYENEKIGIKFIMYVINSTNEDRNRYLKKNIYVMEKREE